jgi:CARDB protein
MRLFPTRYALPFLAVLALVYPGSSAPAQNAKPALILESVKVDPASPGPDTLCRLSVTLRNTGSRRASALEFRVKVDGKELPAYKDRIYLQPVEPGATREVRLFNFWSTEPSRPSPANGKLQVEVTLARASWMDKETKDGAEVWTATGTAEGLPLTKSVTVTMKK